MEVLYYNHKSYKIVELKSKLPSISISGIEEKLDKQELVDHICRQNVEIAALVTKGSTLDIVFIKAF